MSETDEYRAFAEYFLDVFQGDSVGFMQCQYYLFEAIRDLEIERGTVPTDYEKYMGKGAE